MRRNLLRRVETHSADPPGPRANLWTAGRVSPAPMATGTTVQITLPQMGESVTEGTILEWLKQVGDTVELDEGVVEVSTDKVDTEVPSPATGVLTAIYVQPDETVPTGTVLGEIDVSGNGSAPDVNETGGMGSNGDALPASDESAVEE